eukprot:CAMPEP_0114247036 /NCGR_PEP_ID=MMETSP0058-20121206/12800_1 /TAXON_ID=36894 /ORGANISM="Pyramimonas parkeae, CCMP726" /LENGTH=306 /DNA_ID=CAMNT_0001360299 /DNA_START=117 /DNA_END=1037 /DNA_ORIENTATION=-
MDVEAGEGSSLLADWKSYANTTASALGEMGGKLQESTGTGLSAGLTGLSGSFTGLTNLGSGLTASSLTDSFRGASVSAAFSSVQSGVEGLGTSVVSGATFMTSEVHNAASKAGSTAVGGLQMAGSATYKGVKGAGSAVATGVNEVGQGIQSFSRERLTYFFGLLSMGSFLMVLAFIVGLPTIVLAPAKFAFCFTAGSLCNMGAVAALRGPQAQLQSMMAWDRLPFSASYIASMLGTLWAAMIYKSYILTVAFSVWQVMALLYYVASSFPMGVQGMKVVAQIVYTALRPFIIVLNQCCAASFKALTK